MSNDYYNGAGSTFTPFTTAKAEDVAAQFAAVASGLNKLPSEATLNQNKMGYFAAGGSANAITGTPTPVPTSYTAGMGVSIKINQTNTGAATVNVNGLGVKSIKRMDGSALVAGDLLAGSVVDLRYDGTNFRITTSLGELADISATALRAETGSDLVGYGEDGGTVGDRLDELEDIDATVDSLVNLVSGVLTAGDTWIVSDAGGGSGAAGTEADPWSLIWSGDPANADVKPGDTILVRDGTYDYGVRLRCGGAANRKVRYLNYPGETPIISGALDLSGGWTKTTDLVGKQIYTSTAVITGVAADENTNGFIELDGKYWPLMPDRRNRFLAIDATTHNYLANGEYYPGPMLATQTDGKVRIRLDPPEVAAMVGLTYRAGDFITDTDPAANTITLFSTKSVGLYIENDHIEVAGFQFDDVQHCFFPGGAGEWDDIHIHHNSAPRCGFFFLRGGTMTNVLIEDNDADGGLRLGHWVSWIDVKGGFTLGEPLRKNALELGAMSYVTIRRNRIENFFDGILSQGPNADIEVGSYGDGDILSMTPAEREDVAWANANRFINCMDDWWQMYSSAQGVHMHHNYVYGSGFSCDGAASSTDHGDSWPSIHHNIIDSSVYPIFYGRNDSGVGSDGLTNEGIKYGNPINAHGVVSGAGKYTFPRHIFHNTMIYHESNYAQGYMNLGLFSPNADEHSGGQHIVGNNLIVDPGHLYSSGIHFRPVDQYFDSTTGYEIFDGNLYVRATSLQAVGEVGEFMRDIINSAGHSANGHDTLAAMKASVSFTDSQDYYAPGWEDSGVQMVGVREDVLDSNYRPIHADALTGAADLSLLDLTGYYSYQAWRGAKAPR